MEPFVWRPGQVFNLSAVGSPGLTGQSVGIDGHIPTGLVQMAHHGTSNGWRPVVPPDGDIAKNMSSPPAECRAFFSAILLCMLGAILTLNQIGRWQINPIGSIVSSIGLRPRHAITSTEPACTRRHAGPALPATSTAPTCQANRFV